jgi:hypothetical protein
MEVPAGWHVLMHSVKVTQHGSLELVTKAFYHYPSVVFHKTSRTPLISCKNCLKPFWQKRGIDMGAEGLLDSTNGSLADTIFFTQTKL